MSKSSRKMKRRSRMQPGGGHQGPNAEVLLAALKPFAALDIGDHDGEIWLYVGYGDKMGAHLHTDDIKRAQRAVNAKEANSG